MLWVLLFICVFLFDSNFKLDKEFLGRIHNMFQTGEGSDMIIECEEQQFNVHKFILMAHSDVFRAMVIFYF